MQTRMTRYQNGKKILLLLNLVISVTFLICVCDASPRDSNISMEEPVIILDPLKPDYQLGETIQFSGYCNIPETKSLHIEFLNKKHTQKSLPDDLIAYYQEDIPVIWNENTGYYRFAGEISTTKFLPGNYTLFVTAINEQKHERISLNQTTIILTGSQINNSDRQLGNSILITLVLTVTAIGIALIRKKGDASGRKRDV
jgi:hypothetical protein